mmetsp:Transcript_71765/g.155853  ORF Transcript_71765/g.155853 Transcript_71765/m.155853 type:complete len:368 (+) Transcript_71765:65-1168(+)
MVCWSFIRALFLVGRADGERSSETEPMKVSMSDASTCAEGDSDTDMETLGREMMDGIKNLGNEALQWCKNDFELVKTLQAGSHNKCSVKVMKHLDTGRMVAVKKGHGRLHRPRGFFGKKLMTELEMDAGLVRFLHKRNFPYVCEPLGVFEDNLNTYVVTAFAERGDLFSWCEHPPQAGARRETAMKPIITQVITAVRWLHDFNISHGDISLENILLSTKADGSAAAKIIDFGAANMTRMCSGVRGKPSYRAPEMHEAFHYDGFLNDSFALGVLCFCMAAADYPWTSTRASACVHFEFARKNGLRRLLEQRRMFVGGGRLVEYFSVELIEMLEGLLAVSPKDRFTLGEQVAFSGLQRKSVWDGQWLEN